MRIDSLYRTKIQDYTAIYNRTMQDYNRQSTLQRTIYIDTVYPTQDYIYIDTVYSAQDYIYIYIYI